MTPVRLEPVAPQSRVKHSTTEPLCSHIYVWLKKEFEIFHTIGAYITFINTWIMMVLHLYSYLMNLQNIDPTQIEEASYVTLITLMILNF